MISMDFKAFIICQLNIFKKLELCIKIMLSWKYRCSISEKRGKVTFIDFFTNKCSFFILLLIEIEIKLYKETSLCPTG